MERRTGEDLTGLARFTPRSRGLPGDSPCGRKARRRGDVRRRAARSDVRLHHYELLRPEHLAAYFATRVHGAVDVEVQLATQERLQEVVP